MNDLNVNFSSFSLDHRSRSFINEEIIGNVRNVRNVVGGAGEEYSIETLIQQRPPPIFEIEALHSEEIDVQTESQDTPELPQRMQLPLTSPHQYEQNARELLIERERQSRLERERARLKRHLALSRDRQELQQVFNNSYVDDEGQQHDHGSWTSQNQSVFSQEAVGVWEPNSSNHLFNRYHDSDLGDASEILSTHPSNDSRILDHTYKYVMERFLSENVGITEQRPMNHSIEEDMIRTELNSMQQQQQHRASNHFSSRTLSGEIRSTNNIDGVHYDSRFPLLSSSSDSFHVGVDNNLADLNEFNQHMRDHEDDVSNDHEDDDDDADGHDSFTHSNLAVSDDDVNTAHLDDDEDIINSDLDDDHSDTFDYTSSIGNLSTHGTNNLHHFQSFSTFEFRPMSNILSEAGTQTTAHESMSASSIHVHTLTNIHPSFSQLDDQGNFQNTNTEASDETNSITSITSVVANVSVHSDETNMHLSLPRSSRNNTRDGIDSFENRPQQPFVIERSEINSTSAGNQLPSDNFSIDSCHSSLGLGKHPLSDCSSEYDKRNVRTSGRSSKGNNIYVTIQGGVEEENEHRCSSNFQHKVPFTIVSHPQQTKSSDSLKNSGIGSGGIHSIDDAGEHTIKFPNKFLEEQRSIKALLPERVSQLIMTILIEAPVFLIIKSGTGNLARLVGESRFQLILFILPMSVKICRIYGESGLSSQALSSSLASTNELLISSLCIGILLGLMVYSLTFDFGFGVAIAISVTSQILACGLLAFLTPFLVRKQRLRAIYSFAIDIVGCFTMVHSCYQILLLFRLNENVSMYS